MQAISRPLLIKLLKQSKRVVLISHSNPDGDALGSSLGLYHWIKEQSFSLKSCKVMVPNSFPGFLNKLPGCRQLFIAQDQPEKAKQSIQKADLIVLLDFNSLKRIDALGPWVAQSKAVKILIDHHQQPENCADYAFHNVQSCSTSELVFELTMPKSKTQVGLTRSMAACIYTGIMTDTGNFRFSSVRAKTHAIVARLLETGLEQHKIHEMVYDNYSFERMQLLGFGLHNKLKCLPDIPVAYFSFSHAELKSYHYSKGDLEGVVNYGLSIAGIKVCALFNEQEDRSVRISFRSKARIDVNRFARKYFQGGGHINAAGGKSMLSLNKSVERFIQHIHEIL